MSEKKANQSLQTASVTKSSVDAADTNIKNENIKIFGVVENCGQLRIRKEPNKEADVIGTMVDLITDDIIDGFYAIHTEACYGYCMSDFIQVTRAEKE